MFTLFVVEKNTIDADLRSTDVIGCSLKYFVDIITFLLQNLCVMFEILSVGQMRLSDYIIDRLECNGKRKEPYDSRSIRLCGGCDDSLFPFRCNIWMERL